MAFMHGHPKAGSASVHEHYCAGVCGGVAFVDECGVCNGDGATCVPAYDHWINNDEWQGKGGVGDVCALNGNYLLSPGEVDICGYDEVMDLQLHCEFAYDYSCDDQIRNHVLADSESITSVHCCRHNIEDIPCTPNYWLEWPYIPFDFRQELESRGNHPVCGANFGLRWVCGDDGWCKDPCKGDPCEHVWEVCDCNQYGHCYDVGYAYDNTCSLEEEENLMCYGHEHPLCGECSPINLPFGVFQDEEACQESLYFCGQISTGCNTWYNCNYEGSDPRGGNTCPYGYECWYEGDLWSDINHCICSYEMGCDCDDEWVPTCFEPLDGTSPHCCPKHIIGDGMWCDAYGFSYYGSCDLSCYSKEPDGTYCQISGTLSEVVSGLPDCSENHLGPDGGDCEICQTYDGSGQCGQAEGCEGWIANCNWLAPGQYGPGTEYPITTTSYQCCKEIEIGDGYCDGTDQQYGCDLSCYGDWSSPDGDGGDCDNCEGLTVPNCNYDPDMEGSMECCSWNWVGDNFCDNELQCFGCDLTCYGFDNDGTMIYVSDEDKNLKGDDGDCCVGDGCPAPDGFVANCEIGASVPVPDICSYMEVNDDGGSWVTDNSGSTCSDLWGPAGISGDIYDRRVVCDNGIVFNVYCNDECGTYQSSLGDITWPSGEDVSGDSLCASTPSSTDCATGEYSVSRWCPEDWIGDGTCDDGGWTGCDLTCYEGEASECDVCLPNNTDNEEQCAADGGDWQLWEWNDWSILGCWGLVSDDCPPEAPICKFGAQCEGCDTHDDCDDGNECNLGECIPCDPIVEPCAGGGCGSFTDPSCQGEEYDCGDCQDGWWCYGLEDTNAGDCRSCWVYDDETGDCSCDGFIPNCNVEPSLKCCEESWIDDDSCDGPSQNYGCDLSCYSIENSDSSPCEREGYSNNPDYPDDGSSWSGLPWCTADIPACPEDGGDCDTDLGCGCGEAGPSGCDDVCGSTAELDNCGVCDSDSSNDCVQDCAGTWGGSSVVDECNICGGSGPAYPDFCDCDNNPIDSYCNGDGCFCEDCVLDECGECGGTGELDECGVCDGGNAADLGCGCDEPGPSGCDNVCGSTLENDECGVCGGGGIADGECDCNGNVDAGCGCGELNPGGCTGGGNDECDGLVIDECGVCGGPGKNHDCCGNTLTCDEAECLTIDEDEDGICDNADDCVGAFDECGICNGPGADYECGCTDIANGACNCAGDVEDTCSNCPGLGAQDCAGVCGGDSTLDECGVCGGGGIGDGECDCAGNVADCAGNCNGSAEEDCAGYCNGTAGNNSSCDPSNACVGHID